MIGIYTAPGQTIVSWEMVNAASIVLLVILLVSYELAVNAEGEWPQFARYLRIALIPLLLCFYVVLVINVVRLLP